MAGKVSGKYYRKEITMPDAMALFTDEQAAERMFIEVRWPDGIACPHCSSLGVGKRTLGAASWRTVWTP